MIWLNPESVAFGTLEIGEVESVVVDREAVLTAEEFGDAGPFMVFADVPKCRVRVRVARRVQDPSPNTLRLGEKASLVFTPSRNASSASRLSVIMSNAVVISIVHTVARSGASKQVVEFLALSSDGAKDPVIEIVK